MPEHEPAFSKLSGIYDAIDNRQYKNATKLISQQLAKHPKSQTLRALQVLTLNRVGKKAEAEETLAQLVQEDIVSDFVLSPLSSVLRQECRFSVLTEIYERAAKQKPGDLAVIEQLFLCYAREQRFADMQRLAAETARKTGDEKHMLWQAVSVLQQVPTKPEKTNLPLALSLKMLERIIVEKKCRQHEAVLVYCQALQAAGKAIQAADVCLGDISSAFKLSSDRLSLLARCYAMGGKFDHANAISRVLIQEQPDNWDSYVLYLDALDQLLPGPSGIVELPLSSDKGPLRWDGTLDEAFDFLTSQRQQSNRTPYLAAAELCYRALQRGVEAHVLDRLSTVLQETFSAFGSKPLTALENARYAAKLHDLAAERLQFLKDFLRAPPEGPPTIERLRTEITAYKLLQFVGDPDFLNDIQPFLQRYEDALPLSAQLERSERGYGDDLILLATNVLFNKYLAENHEPHLLHALALLEVGHKKSPANFSFAVLKAVLYGKLGSPRDDITTQLDVKHVQLDSLSYLVFPGLCAAGHWDKVQTHAAAVIAFHASHQRETPEGLAQVFRHQSWSKVGELLAINKRFDGSLTHLECATYWQLLTVLADTKDLSEEQIAKLRKFVDCEPSANEDLDPVEITLTRTRGSEAQQKLLNALLPGSLQCNVQERRAQCAFRLELTYLLKCLGNVLEQPKGKKGQPPVVDSVRLTNCWEQLHKAFAACTFSTIEAPFWAWTISVCQAVVAALCDGVALPDTAAITEILRGSPSLLSGYSQLSLHVAIAIRAISCACHLRVKLVAARPYFDTILSSLVAAVESAPLKSLCTTWTEHCDVPHLDAMWAEGSTIVSEHFRAVAHSWSSRHQLRLDDQLLDLKRLLKEVRAP